jgi:hypothetical protein
MCRCPARRSRAPSASPGGDIAGDLDLSGAKLTGKDQDGYALVADGLKVGENAVLRDGFEAVGAVRLTGADITGSLDMVGAKLSGKDKYGSALFADRLKVGGGVYLRDDFEAAGSVRLPGADITGNMDMDGAKLSGKDNDGYALFADGLKVGGGVGLRDGFDAAGAVHLSGVDITGSLDMVGAKLSGKDKYGSALVADELKLGGTALLRDGFEAAGLVRLLGADITGDLDLSGAKLTGTDQDGYALVADGLKVGRNVYLADGFKAAGAVRLPVAGITGNLEMDGAKVTGSDQDGYALVAHGLRVGGGVRLRDGFEAAGAISLGGARVGGRLDLTDAAGIRRLVLQDARCSELADTESAWPPKGQLMVGGFQFDRLDDRAGWKRRLEWVRRQGYGANWSADPYEQLAAFYTRTGEETAARQIRIAKNDDELEYLRRKGDRRGTLRYRLWRRPFGWLLGYGYRRYPAGLLLVATIVLAGVTFRWLNDIHTMVPNVDAGTAALACGKPYPCFNAAVYGADVVLPIIDFGQDSAWRPNSKGDWGSLGQDLRWVFIAIGWVLGSIFVVAFTNLVRRD